MVKRPCSKCTKNKVKNKDKPVFMVYDPRVGAYVCLSCGNVKTCLGEDGQEDSGTRSKTRRVRQSDREDYKDTI